MRKGTRWPRLALLSVAVLAVHVWFLAGMPLFVAAPRGDAPRWTARTVAPRTPEAPAAPQTAVKPESPSTSALPSTPVAKKPDAPRKPAIVKVADTSQPATERAAVAVAPASHVAEPEAQAPSTREAGAARATRVAVPASARFNYDVTAYTKGFTLSGSARLDWRNLGGEYEAQLTLSAPLLPTRTQRSTGLLTAQGLAPVRFSNKVRTEEATHFDRENGKVVFSSNKPDAPLEAGIQDRLSIVLQLGAMLAGEPSRYPAGSRITVQTASTKEAEPWTFTVDAPETLALPGGRVQAVRLIRNPRKEYDVKVELWLAPGAAYAPVRLRLTQPNGDWVDQQWSSTDRG